MKIKQTGFLKKKKAGVTAKSVCFSCRKCFHRIISHCLECNGAVSSVGNFFRAPKKSNIKHWLLIEKMVLLANYRFSKYGASGPMPSSLKMAEDIVLQKIRQLEPNIYRQKNIKDINGKLIPQNFNY